MNGLSDLAGMAASMSSSSPFSNMNQEDAASLIEKLIEANEKANANVGRLIKGLERRQVREEMILGKIMAYLTSKMVRDGGLQNDDKEFLNWLDSFSADGAAFVKANLPDLEKLKNDAIEKKKCEQWPPTLSDQDEQGNQEGDNNIDYGNDLSSDDDDGEKKADSSAPVDIEDDEEKSLERSKKRRRDGNESKSSKPNSGNAKRNTKRKISSLANSLKNFYSKKKNDTIGATNEEISNLEKRVGFRLPGQLRYLLKLCAPKKLQDSDIQLDSRSYNPLTSLLPIENIGYYEMFGVDESIDEDNDDDDEIVRETLSHFDTSHQFDDEFICSQLCGKNKPTSSRFKLLLISAPIRTQDGDTNIETKIFLNIRAPIEGDENGESSYFGDGMLYRLEGNEDGDESELIRIGTVCDWLEQSLKYLIELNADGNNFDVVQKCFPKIYNRIKTLVQQKDMKRKGSNNKNDEDDDMDDESNQEEDDVISVGSIHTDDYLA